MTIILNGLPRKKKKFYSEFYPTLQKHFTITVQETQHGAHAEELAYQAAEGGVAVLLAAGGDGTLHQVINGILKSNNSSIVLGLIPLGSANDFAKTCGLMAGPDHLVKLLTSLQSRPTDVGSIHCTGNSGAEIHRYFMNVCSVGMGPAVVKRLLKSKGWLGPSISYLSSIFTTFLTHRPQEVDCKTPSWEWKGVARVVALANGKSFGDSTFIAPDAETDDGTLNSFIAGNIPLWKFLVFLQTIKGKKKISDPAIHYNSTQTAELRSPKSCALEGDGELIGFLPATIDVLSGKLNFLR